MSVWLPVVEKGKLKLKLLITIQVTCWVLASFSPLDNCKEEILIWVSVVESPFYKSELKLVSSSYKTAFNPGKGSMLIFP